MTDLNLAVDERPEPHYAFKKGYRLGLQKQPFINMPSYIRQDDVLRQSFEQGWLLAQEELQAGTAFNKKPNMRYRATWIVMTALAGAATAGLIINDSNHFSLSDLERVLQRAPASAPPIAPALTTAPNRPATNPLPSTTDSDPFSLSLLSETERLGLSALKTVETELSAPILRQSIKPSSAIFSATLHASNDAEQHFSHGSNVPKFIRQLRFSLDTRQLNVDQITVRWLWQNRIMQTQVENISAKTHNTTSVQQLYSAWQGDWDIEILDPQDNVLYRYSFIYGHE